MMQNVFDRRYDSTASRLWLELIRAHDRLLSERVQRNASRYQQNRGQQEPWNSGTGLLPSSSPHVGPMLDALRDPEHLWSPYGLRSLSASHSEFGQGENYWKGPIWIQMNYLALRALYKVSILFIVFMGRHLMSFRNTLWRKGPTERARRRFIISLEKTSLTMYSR